MWFEDTRSHAAFTSGLNQPRWTSCEQKSRGNPGPWWWQSSSYRWVAANYAWKTNWFCLKFDFFAILFCLHLFCLHLFLPFKICLMLFWFLFSLRSHPELSLLGYPFENYLQRPTIVADIIIFHWAKIKYWESISNKITDLELNINNAVEERAWVVDPRRCCILSWKLYHFQGVTALMNFLFHF